MLEKIPERNLSQVQQDTRHRYEYEFAVRPNSREEDTIDRMKIIVVGMIGRRIMFKDLVSGEDGRLH